VQFSCRTVAIAGVGLIGASIGLALRASHPEIRRIGVGRSKQTLLRAQRLGAIDAIAEPEQAAQEADLFVIAAPLGAYPSILRAIAPVLREHPRLAITDAGSTKRQPLAQASEILGDRAKRFVGAHPIAGAERSGPDAARADLFQQRACILTPQDCDPDALFFVEAFWRALGARISVMDAESHDRLFARISHLPHLAAYALVNAIVRLAGREEPFAFAGAGFRDFTRIASSSPEMWRDIALANADVLVQALDALRAEIDALREAVARKDAEALFSAFAAAKQARDEWLARHRCEEESCLKS